MGEAVEKIESLTTSGPTDKTTDQESLGLSLRPSFLCKPMIGML